MKIKLNFEVHVYQKDDKPQETKVHQEVMLLAYAHHTLERLTACRAASTMTNYQTALRSFVQYLEHDIPMSKIDTVLISGYEHWLRTHNISLNTISCYMRSLRSLLGNDYRQAFTHVFTGDARTNKRAISIESINRLRAISLPKGTFLALARDVFLFSFYAMGMPFVDVVHLKRQQIGADSIVYFRQKTGTRVCVPLVPAMVDIIERYTSQSDYVFPLINQGTFKEYQLLLSRYNRALYRLALKASINEKLTSYVVRHSWASAAYEQDVELNVISKALGHTNPNTTLIYIREINDQRLQQASKQVLDKLEDLNKKR